MTYDRKTPKDSNLGRPCKGNSDVRFIFYTSKQMGAQLKAAIAKSGKSQSQYLNQEISHVLQKKSKQQ